MGAAAIFAAAAVVSAYGKIQEGKAQEEAAKSQAQAAEYNATVSTQNAQIARNNASIREEVQRRKSRSILAQQFAGTAQAGIDFSGTAADVFTQSETMAELDALNIRYEGDLQSRGLLAEATGERYQAEAALVNGKNARTAANISAAGSLLQGASGYKYMSSTPSSATTSTPKLS